MVRCSIDPRTRKYVKGYGFLSFGRMKDQMLQKLLLKKQQNQKVKFQEKKIANKVVKPKLMLDENSGNVEEIIIPPEKR